ncbi:hypothetical protein FIM12_06295 [SAR202 cluster bacterium AD-804-J14_MRT_500m]|nr:hypothetical protein [SAR202 cluster bacterium AD-804-J14_MRT_500m]
MINETPDEDVPEGHVITLHLLTPENGLETIDATTDRDGKFNFHQVPFLGSGRYLLSCEFDGIDYSLEFTEEDARQPLFLTVFAASSELSLITHRSHIWLLQNADPESGILSALEIALIENPHNKTFKPSLDQPGNMQFLRFSIPFGAHGLNVQSDLRGGEIIDVGTGFGLTSPIRPGSHQIVFSYLFPYEDSQTDVSKRFLQDVEVFRLLVPPDIGNVSRSTLEVAESTTIGDITYKAWETREILSGNELEIYLSDLPQLSFWDRFSKSITRGTGLTVGIPAALGAGLIILLLYTAVVRRNVPIHKSVSLYSESGQTTQDQLDEG